MTVAEARDRKTAKGRCALDMAAILQPLAGGEGGAGPDLRDAPDGPFHAIEEARRQDDGLDQGIWVHERKTADWNEVVALCQDALIRRTKDLRLAVWMVEALVQRDGFAGLGPGFRLLGSLCEAFWPHILPAIDEVPVAGVPLPDYEARANAIALLDARLPRVLRTIPITRTGMAEPVTMGWGDYEMARLHEARGAGQKGGLTVAGFQAAADATSVELLRKLQADLAEGLDAVEGLDAFLDRMCGRAAPSLTGLKSLLTEIQGWLRATLPPPPPEPEPAPEPGPAEGEGGAHATEGDPEMSHSRPAGSGDGPIASREDAYRRLGEIADYLMRAEPHSPTPYVLKRVHAWGRMPLHELLMEMAHGRNDLAAIMELLSPTSQDGR